MSSVWIDVSHILTWNGNLSGIERVEYHIIRHYFNNTEAEFVRWDDSTESFRIIEREVVHTRIVKRTSEEEQNAKFVTNDSSLGGRVFKKIRSRAKGDSWNPKSTIIVLSGLWDNNKYITALQYLSNSNDIIHIVYDMIPLVQPGYVVDYLPEVFGNYMLKILPKCKRIMSISEATKNDITKVLGENNLHIPEIIPFRLGDDISRARTSVRPKNTPDNFVLSVSTLEARKNHILLYYAYKLATEKGVKIPPIVIAGRPGWLTSDLQYILRHDPSVRDNIVWLDTVSDSEMRWLYENCLFTVFPSIYEGWGLPVAESLNYGKVTLASDSSSIPEVGNGNVDYFSPFSSNDLLVFIEKYSKPSNRKKREENIATSYKPMLWDEAASNFHFLATPGY